MYDPHVGRWISEDPDGFGASDVNLYRYVINGPLDAVDPSGTVPDIIPKTKSKRRDYVLFDTQSDHWPVHPPANVALGKVIYAKYIQFNTDGAFQDAWVNQPNRIPPGEVGWIVPIYPGRTLFWQLVALAGEYVYAGGSGNPGRPPRSDFQTVLHAGDGLLFSGRADTGTADGRFLGIVDPKLVKPARSQTLVIVGRDRPDPKSD
jgi:hypothetical protein